MEVNTRIHRLQSGIWSPGLRSEYLRLQVGRQLYSAMPHIVAGLRGNEGAMVNRGTGLEGWLADPATIIDFPAVIDVARRYVEEAGLLDRIDFIEGNSLDVQWPQDQDVILMSYLVSAIPVQNHPTVLNGPGTLLPVAASS